MGQLVKDVAELQLHHGVPLRIGEVAIPLADPKAVPIPQELRKIAGHPLEIYLSDRRKAMIESLRKNHALEETKVRASLEIMEGMEVFDFAASYPLAIGEEKTLKIFEGRASVLIRIDTVQLLTDFHLHDSDGYSFIVNFTDLELGVSYLRVWKLEILRNILAATSSAFRLSRPKPELPPEGEGEWRALIHQNGRGIISHFFYKKKAFCSVAYEYSVDAVLEDLTIPRKDGDHRCSKCLSSGAPAPTPPCDCRKCLLKYHEKKLIEARKLEKKKLAQREAELLRLERRGRL